MNILIYFSLILIRQLNADKKFNSRIHLNEKFIKGKLGENIY